MKITDTERDIEAVRVENGSLKYRVNQLQNDRESNERILQHLQFEKAEQELRAEELEKENRTLKEEVSFTLIQLSIF